MAILERASAGAPATETRYLWCGDRICQARDASGNVTARFFPQGETSVVAGSPVLSYYAKDNLGSVVQMVDTTGAAVGEQRYTDYGGLELSTGKKPTFGYAGMFQHNPSALSLTQYRAYDSSTGRWLSRDPIEEAGGLNLYGYVGGGPINYVDPQGEWALAAAYGGVIGAISGYASAKAIGGDSTDAFWAGTAGLVSGAAVGVVIPDSIPGATVASAVGAATGDWAGQALANRAKSKDSTCASHSINWGEVAGAGIGGSLAGLAPGDGLALAVVQGQLGFMGGTAGAGIGNKLWGQ